MCGESNFLLTSINLPVVSQVIAASVKEPILGLMLRLEMPMVREILSQQEFALREESTDARGMAVGVSSGTCWTRPRTFHSWAISSSASAAHGSPPQVCFLPGGSTLPRPDRTLHDRGN
jgi:AraC-type transcriptional regulator N-terminus